jgi:uncharacterized ferritin-like protein (DUF455 family)
VENIFSIAEYCLHQNDIASKLAATHHARELAIRGQLSYESTASVTAISKIQFPEQPILLAPRDMPRRKLKSQAGKAAFFHALAHIEFVAIYLAWDMLYRFRNLPDRFYQDWLKVADEEAQHFQLIRSHLLALGMDYGDLPAHRGLWEHAEDTANDVLARLAIVPRCMEARGLDITPQMIEKFEKQGDTTSVKLLTRILNDEVGHVEIGSYWFKVLCEQQGLNSELHYKELIERFYVGKPKGPFNRELRIIAGFTHAEIDWLEQSL